MNIFKRIMDFLKKRKKQKELIKRLEEIKKRDPFIYK